MEGKLSKFSIKLTFYNEFSNLYRAVSSDPLIKASIKGFNTLQTKSIAKNLDPVWNEELVFPGVTDPSLSLQITVEDYDLTKNDFMVNLSLNYIFFFSDIFIYFCNDLMIYYFCREE